MDDNSLDQHYNFQTINSYSILLQFIITVFIAFVQDYYKTKLKITILTLMSVSMLLILWMILLWQKLVPFDLTQMYRCVTNTFPNFLNLPNLPKIAKQTLKQDYSFGYW